jgi:hypothetical protein
MTKKNIEPLAVSITVFSELTQLGRTTAYKLIAQGRLKKVKVLGRTLITMDSIQELIAGTVATEGR